ncbi:MAG: AIPR family protein, partial [Geobacteraceae bacterium]
MDRVTKSFLTDFTKLFSFDTNTDEKILFEHFVNYTIIEPKAEYQFDVEKTNIGNDGTIGIDGFAIILNKQVINTEDELQDFLTYHKKCSAEIVFIQSKTSPSFDSKEVGGFGFSVNDFIAETQKLKWSNIAIEKIGLFNTFVKKIPELKENPICSLYYVSLGKNEKDQNVYAKIDDIKRNIMEENIFSEIHFDLVDASELQNKYKQIGQAVSKSFEFAKRVTLPLISDVDESYIGVVEASTIIHLMSNDDGTLLSNVFYDNVRDFQGSNKVNDEIEDTLQSSYKDSFSILNNGITIVAESLVPTRDNFTITNYQ